MLEIKIIFLTSFNYKYLHMWIISCTFVLLSWSPTTHKKKIPITDIFFHHLVHWKNNHLIHWKIKLGKPFVFKKQITSYKTIITTIVGEVLKTVSCPLCKSFECIFRATIFNDNSLIRFRVVSYYSICVYHIFLFLVRLLP